MFKKIGAVALLAMATMTGLKADPAPGPNIGLENVCVNTKRIEFNHKDGFSDDAYDIRKDSKNELAHSDPGEGGEWTLGGRKEEVMYDASADSVKIKVQFQATDPNGLGLTFPFSVKIKAVMYQNKLCNLAEQTITFDGATSPWYEFVCSRQPYYWDNDDKKSFEITDGWFDWRVKNVDGTKERRANWSNHKVFCIMEDGIKAPWKQDDSVHEPWVKALDWADDQVSLDERTDKDNVAETATNWMWDGQGHTYDIGSNPGVGSGGGSKYLVGWKFDLDSFIDKTNTTVNCYDQAIAVTSVLNLVGVHTDFAQIVNTRTADAQQYGYSTSGGLVGITALVNNPFYGAQDVDTVKEVDLDLLESDKHIVNGINTFKRTKFANHGIAMRDATEASGSVSGGNVYDATIGVDVNTPYVKKAIATYLTDVQDIAPSSAVPAPVPDPILTEKTRVDAVTGDAKLKTGSVTFKVRT